MIPLPGEMSTSSSETRGLAEYKAFGTRASPLLNGCSMCLWC
jgi:hypothetical protein